MIARRMGERQPEQVGRNFYAMLYFELGLALVMFLFMQFGAPYFLTWFVKMRHQFMVVCIDGQLCEGMRYRTLLVFPRAP